ncbi:MAG: FAD-dependent oxidoreductase [Candidatus Saccharibacteria bacterium]|nr:FAD-dependent oxidoreductase [Candidatus Saccharibacteria bacterium]
MANLLDLIIIGSGPAACTAALYAARAGLTVALYEKALFGGALIETAHIANFPGFDGPGQELADRLKTQAEAAGAKFYYGECTAIDKVSVPVDSQLSVTNSSFVVTIDGEKLFARTVLVATGSRYRQLDFTLEKPISYCALCDGPLYKDKRILVIGGGNSAVGEAAHLASIAKSVILVNRSPLRAESALIKKLESFPNIEIHTSIDINPNSQPFAKYLTASDGVFVFIGKQPAADFLPSHTPSGEPLKDTEGYILTDSAQMTALSGLFAAGDVRSGALRQAVTAAAEGAIAAVHITSFLKN